MDWDQRECACTDKSAKGGTGRQQELSDYGRRWQFHSARATPLGDPPFFLPLHPPLSLPFLSSAVCWLLCSIDIGAGRGGEQKYANSNHSTATTPRQISISVCMNENVCLQHHHTSSTHHYFLAL